ncbi:hypothetical protein BKA67DRAFT_528935 [Truncatella angustata]|uniref:Mtf2-like C-terminal domain-containing protein n=1 Tax=Truncatella angustata TaxID=152316 RepID=A0A9P8RDZ9_9PEZI|nr:uncharacterized protein BKA67DRAFT_528935 [Truncatella angustata]KAH6638525.1 hypothetical protein BKA67DRAFT_528935 [Truncatella angustata]KAH8197087.1 hypothetical protein TruAng_008757 [Truncatella angustata]
MSNPPLLFLYQTRTILRSRHLPSVSRALHATPSRRRRGDNDIPFASGRPGDDVHVPLVEETKGTITPTERQTFDRIFTDIANRGLKPRLQADGQPPGEVTRRATNLILEAATVDATGEGIYGKAISAPQFAVAAKDKEKALLRFPPSLRAAASRAFELLNPDHSTTYSSRDGSKSAKKGSDNAEAEWQTPQNTFLRMVEVDSKRLPEQNRVEALMAMAKSDFELWDVMEKEVFSYPERLGLRNGTIQQTSGSKTKGRNARNRQSRAQLATQLSREDGASSESTTDALRGDPKLNLYIYGPLYPSFLLFGLRRLDNAFATPSPLALSVLPRIKELGLESFVLGVSTPFYNELLDIQYGRYGDISSMMDLLEEMSHSGLYFDEGTASVLNKAYNQTQDLSTGSHGLFAKALMTMPAYEQSVRNRIRYWHSKIDVSIEQRDADIDYTRLQQQ